MITLGELAESLGLTFHGESGRVLKRLASLDLAGSGDVSFLSDRAFVSSLEKTRAEAVILHPDYASYKNSIVAIMHNLYRVLKTEYEITRNPQLVLGQINPLNLALRFPSIY